MSSLVLYMCFVHMEGMIQSHLKHYSDYCILFLYLFHRCIDFRREKPCGDEADNSLELSFYTIPVTESKSVHSIMYKMLLNLDGEQLHISQGYGI